MMRLPGRERKIAVLLAVLCCGLPDGVSCEERQQSEPAAVEKSVEEQPSPEATKPLDSESLANEPLDSWHPVDPTPTPSPTAVPTATPVEEGSVGFRFTEEEVQRKRSLIIPGGVEVPLMKKQRRRLQRLSTELRRRRRLAERSVYVDPRGRPELVLCSVNLNNYGIKPEMIRLFKLKGVWRKRAIERSVVEAVVAAGCNVVALQGVFGRSRNFAGQAMGELIAALEKRTKTKGEWESCLSDHKNELGKNAFLFRRSEIELIEPKTIIGELLVPREMFGLKSFLRSPLQILIKVKGQEEAPSKTFVILNYHFQQGLKLSPKTDTEESRMQMAQALVELAAREEVRDLPPFVGKPSAILVGDRAAAGLTPTRFLLEGRANLNDFESSGVCKLIKREEKGREKVAFGCAKGKGHPQLFFNPFVESSYQPVSYKKRRVGKGEHKWVKVKNDNSEALRIKEFTKNTTAEIYLRQQLLEYAKGRTGFSVSTFKVRNDLKGSPFIAVTLNW